MHKVNKINKYFSKFWTNS